jgi:hypothetical protein
MEKEFHVIEVGFIGSFLEERADNDGDTLRKNISLNVPDNNIYVINPVTGLLESKIGDADTDNPQFVQFNSDKPSSPSTNLIIKNIGRTIKIVNTTNTELCVNETISGSNYKYESGSIPVGAESCLKSIYFTSNKNIHWPKLDQTYAVLDDLGSKIPYDEGFSKKYYKIHSLTDEQLQVVESETKISHHFLKKLHTLFLFDSEYPDNIENSKIKLSMEWDGYSVDKNNPNNLVYSDYFKTGSAEYANFVFLVNDRTLDDLREYFLSGSIEKENYFSSTKTYNPEMWIDKKYEKREYYGNLVSLKVKNLSLENQDNQMIPTEEQILDILYKKELYRMNPEVTDIDLVEDIVATNIFMDIIQESDIFVFTKIDNTATDTSINAEILSIETNLNSINPLLEKYGELIPTNKMSINNKVFSLIKTYTDFQKNNRFPGRLNITPIKDKFGTLFTNQPFEVTNEFGLPFLPENLSREFIIEVNPETNLLTVTTSSIDIDTVGNQSTPQVTITDIVNVFQESTPIHKRLNLETDFAESKTVFLTKPIFSNGLDRNRNFYTSSAPINHLNYYIPIYTDNPENPLSKYIFDIAYAHISGSGSSYVNNDTEYLPAKTLYKKYVAECFGNQEYMIFKNNVISDYFYILQFNRDVFKDRLDSQNIQITFSPISSSYNQLINTGSNFSSDENSTVIYKLIDDSKTMKVYSSSMFGVEEYYNLVEGTQQDGLKYEEEYAEGWGLIFPRRGLVLLDGKVMDKYCNFNTVTASIEGDNSKKLFVSISSSCSPNSSRTNNEYWYVRSAEQYSDQNYFCRVGQNEFNYTNNYTYTSGSARKIFYDRLNNTTKTYISTIGLYDDNKNLLAVGKLTKSLLKDSSEEYIFNVRIKSN